MSLPWFPVVFVDIAGSLLMLLVSAWCAVLGWRLTKIKPDDVFRNYIFLFTLATLFFSVSRSFGHLFKQLLLMNNMQTAWSLVAPYSGAVNTIAFVVIFAFGISFHRFQKVHTDIEYYKENLEDLVATRTKQLESSKNTLENILNNSNPINITTCNFDMVQANDAYYHLWPKRSVGGQVIKCYESRPGEHCDTDDCPLRLIVAGHEEVTQEVTKAFDGELRDFIITARPFRDIDGKLIGMVESFQDITLRKKAERAMRESEERFRKIFESNPDPVVLAKVSDGAIIDTNQAFEIATGIKRANAIGKNSAELNLWADMEDRQPFRQLLMTHGEINNLEAEFKVVDGSIKTGLVSASMLKVNMEPCVLLVVRDITTEKAAERALIDMDRIKGEFISTAAHELNTPLSTMMGYTEFLRDEDTFGGFSEEQKRQFVEEIYENAESLSRIIEDLLDISRIESGKPIPLDLQNEDITEIVSRKVSAYQAHDSTHSFLLHLPDPPRKPVIKVDRQRINQALENLMSNAMKYSPEGSTINVTMEETDREWRISIIDEGVGMNAEQLSRIFDKFYRADASNTAIPGLGLGMSIVKQVITAHGGRIHIESIEGQGTTATFTLPFAASRLFVYGTLAPGQSGHHLIEKLDGDWQKGTVRGRLIPEGVGLTDGYPVIDLGHTEEKVDGIMLTSEELGLHWHRIDEYEGQGYKRVQVKVEMEDGEHVDAFIYALDDDYVHDQ